MAGKDDEQVAQIAEQVKRYLRAHPKAVDSLEGIVDWWLPRQRQGYAGEAEKVQKALDYLVNRDEISRIRGPDGSVLYGSSIHEHRH